MQEIIKSINVFQEFTLLRLNKKKDVTVLSTNIYHSKKKNKSFSRLP